MTDEARGASKTRGASKARSAGKARGKGPLETADLEALALSYLNRFDCSVAKLRTHLRQTVRRRGGDQEALESHIGVLLERYQASGVLNDARFAENLASRLSERGKSRRAIVQKLRQRGVAAPVAEASAPTTPGAELEAARAFVRRRRLGPHRPEAERLENRRRDLAALARHGFDHETAVRALGYGRDDDF